ncbi:MAG: hypothetical protein U7127_00575 [Phormidium sp.]
MYAWKIGIKTLSFLLLFANLFFSSIVLAQQSSNSGCRTIVQDPQAPLNVRSSPEVKPNNVVGKLNNNTVIRVVNNADIWLQINAPISGWVDGRRTAISCGSSTNNAYEVTANIAGLAKRAMGGDRIAADTLVRYSRQADGYVTEAIGYQLSEWAKINPKFLISVLDKQPEDVRLRTLSILDFGFGIDQKARQQFAANLANFSKNSPTVRAWQSRSFERNNP